MGKFLRYEPCPECRRRGHDNRGDNLAVYSDGGMFCFSCRYYKPSRRPAALAAEKETINVPKNLLPFDFTREVPNDALRWLLQWGLPWSYWKETIGFSPSESRLVFRVGNPLAFSIGRLIGEPRGESHAKRRKWYVWGDSHKHVEVYGQGNKIVLVEDLISAAKIGQTGVRAISLFGTQVHKPVVYYLMQENIPTYLWLDKDQHGTVYQKAASLQALVGVPVQVVVSDVDPKALSFDNIIERIK